MRTTADQLRDVLDHWQSGTGPLYSQLADAIVSLAEAGSLDHGTRLPSERALAEALHLSRNTVTAAYQRLRDDEWLEVRPGAAPTLGARARGLDGMSYQDRFAKILPGTRAPLVGLSSACPPPAPVVTEALRDPGELLDGSLSGGTGYAALGDPELVRAVVEHLRSRGIDAHPDEVVITAGGQQALWLAVTALAGPSCPVAMEAVAYPGVFDALTSAGSRPLALPMTREGLDVTASVKLIRAARPDVAYLTSFQNPTGTVLEEEDALRLLAAASAAGTTVIDDRITGELALTGSPRPPFASLETDAAVVTIGGLSKVFWGGLRIGWLHANATLATQLRNRKAAMDLGSPAFFQQLATRFLTEHYEATLAWRLDAMRESLAATVDAIVEHGLDWEFRTPDGGPCLWVRIPGGNAERFAARASDAGVPVAPGTAFEVVPGQGSEHFRLPFYLSPEEMRLGVKVLAERAA
ncbi:PLP-dependent aminotransferase family protein [Demequina sp. NBRC 110056]|uniref:aminotransferase-like domain-containing protein n=1 Tax=Demequina sp. NBRC 110056 TaxID=1570345 RepID=UPI000A02FF01|nr:PLP-dependent aminotransferase family protein [Demequina sp. NBRC 110056]